MLFLKTCSEVGEEKCEFSPGEGPLRKEVEFSWQLKNRLCHLETLLGKVTTTGHHSVQMKEL